MKSEEFKSYLKSERAKNFISPFNLVYQAFCHLGYDKQPAQFFKNNASEIVIALRAKCWEEFVPKEAEFTSRVLCSLIDDKNVNAQKSKEAIIDFVYKYSSHLYELFLSNTQSRRSRAGKEFEAIIELLIAGAQIPVDTQGVVGKKNFEEKNLGKLVDFVSPGVIEYASNKQDSVLISAKTTLRERWQEVPEEITRTCIPQMYLATLDDSISDQTLQILYDANVIVVTTKSNKLINYSKNNRVKTFEELIQIMEDKAKLWSSYEYSDEENMFKSNLLLAQMDKYKNISFVENYYKKRFDILK